MDEDNKLGVYMTDHNNKILSELKEGFNTAFIDSNLNSNLAYRPEFVSNDYKQGKKVLTTIEQELACCDEFCISVAFITLGGITPLLQTLKELEQRNIPGKILTTDYLMFSDPGALEKLSNLTNIQMKMFCTNPEIGGFHTKGYIFKNEEIYHIIVGSSNMTLNAITKNREWNTKIVATQKGAMVQDILSEFDSLWEDENSKKYEDISADYRMEYLKNKLIKQQQITAKENAIVNLEQYVLKPNKMQVAFIANLNKMLVNNVGRALLISSTG